MRNPVCQPSFLNTVTGIVVCPIGLGPGCSLSGDRHGSIIELGTSASRKRACQPLQISATIWAEVALIRLLGQSIPKLAGRIADETHMNVLFFACDVFAARRSLKTKCVKQAVAALGIKQFHFMGRDGLIRRRLFAQQL